MTNAAQHAVALVTLARQQGARTSTPADVVRASIDLASVVDGSLRECGQHAMVGALVGLTASLLELASRAGVDGDELLRVAGQRIAAAAAERHIVS